MDYCERDEGGCAGGEPGKDDWKYRNEDIEPDEVIKLCPTCHKELPPKDVPNG